MSYDISLKETVTRTITEDVYHFNQNYTYNVSQMLVLALGEGGINQFHCKKAVDCIAVLEQGIAKMKANPAAYEALNPANGWGSYEGILKVLEELNEACLSHPESTIDIS